MASLPECIVSSSLSLCVLPLPISSELGLEAAAGFLRRSWKTCACGGPDVKDASTTRCQPCIEGDNTGNKCVQSAERV